MTGDGEYVFAPEALSREVLEQRLVELQRQSVDDLVARARGRVQRWSWSKPDSLSFRPEPLYAERFDSRTKPERPGEPQGEGIRFGRDRDGLVAWTDVADLGLWGMLESDRGLRFEAWPTREEGVLLGHRVLDLWSEEEQTHGPPPGPEELNRRFRESVTPGVMGVQRRYFDAGRVRAFARLSWRGHYELESYDYRPGGSLSGIRSDSPAAWSQFYMQVDGAGGRRQKLTFAPRWAVDSIELTDDAVDELESRLTSGLADRIGGLLAASDNVADALIVVIFGELPDPSLLLLTSRHEQASWKRRRYRAFDFHLFDEWLDAVSGVTNDSLAGLGGDYELLVRERTKRRQQQCLRQLMPHVALQLNKNPEGFVDTAAPLVIAREMGTRAHALQQLRASIPEERLAAIELADREKEARHARTRPARSIALRSAKRHLLELAEVAGCDVRRPDAVSPRQLFDAFIAFIAVPINGVEEDHEEIQFEVHSSSAETTSLRLVRLISRYDKHENYVGMQAIDVDLLFRLHAPDQPADTMIATSTVGGGAQGWLDAVRASAAFATLCGGELMPDSVEIVQGAV